MPGPVPTSFTVEVLTWNGLVTYYVLFSFIWKAAGSAWRGSLDIRSSLAEGSEGLLKYSAHSRRVSPGAARVG
jgi:hypothetical protein